MTVGNDGRYRYDEVFLQIALEGEGYGGCRWVWSAGGGVQDKLLQTPV